MTLRVAIVDDEPIARELLREMLASYDDVQVIGEYGDGKTAVEAIRASPPDLVFLDVQMPELDGFEVLRSLDEDTMPGVVFVTAYDEYALRAFEVDALDYLLKPFDEERLERTLRRIRERHRDPGMDARRVLEILERVARRESHRDRLVVRRSDRAFFLSAREIDWIEAAGKQVRVHAGEEVHEIRDSMQNLEDTLDPESFLRVSRSAIVNVHRIVEVQPWFHGDHLLVMENGEQVTTTRTYRGAVNRLLE